MKLPVQFESHTEVQSGIVGSWQTVTGDFASEVAIPPEFGGPGGALSPEDLFNHALVSCFLGTFKVLASNSKLDFASVAARSRLVVDHDDNKKPVMKQWILHVTITKPSDAERAKRLADKAAQSGFILNSVNTDRVIEVAIEH